MCFARESVHDLHRRKRLSVQQNKPNILAAIHVLLNVLANRIEQVPPCAVLKSASQKRIKACWLAASTAAANLVLRSLKDEDAFAATAAVQCSPGAGR
jgi:hypothetical protein